MDHHKSNHSQGGRGRHGSIFPPPPDEVLMLLEYMELDQHMDRTPHPQCQSQRVEDKTEMNSCFSPNQHIPLYPFCGPPALADFHFRRQRKI